MTTYVIANVELFPGNALFGRVEQADYDTHQEIFDSVLSDGRTYITRGLRGDELSQTPPCATTATSGSGILLRDSYEHAVIWFPLPAGVIGFYSHRGILFSVLENEYRTFLHHWPFLLTLRISGIHCVDQKAVTMLSGGAAEIGAHSSFDRAIKSTQADIDTLLNYLEPTG